MKGSTLSAWTGAFGNAYTQRNAVNDTRIARKAEMWKTVLRSISTALPKTLLEVGANAGINLRALQQLHTMEMYALEPNAKARELLVRHRVVPVGHLVNGTAEHIDLADDSVDLVFTNGVLIHIAPDDLESAYREIFRVSRRYVLTIEYFAHEPETKPYRGEIGLLFKRDFGALWLDLYPNLKLVDYGFFWKRATGLDNLTWWLFAKP